MPLSFDSPSPPPPDTSSDIHMTTEDDAPSASSSDAPEGAHTPGSADTEFAPPPVEIPYLPPSHPFAHLPISLPPLGIRTRGFAEGPLIIRFYEGFVSPTRTDREPGNFENLTPSPPLTGGRISYNQAEHFARQAIRRVLYLHYTAVVIDAQNRNGNKYPTYTGPTMYTHITLVCCENTHVGAQWFRTAERTTSLRPESGPSISLPARITIEAAAGRLVTAAIHEMAEEPAPTAGTWQCMGITVRVSFNPTQAWEPEVDSLILGTDQPAWTDGDIESIRAAPPSRALRSGIFNDTHPPRFAPDWAVVSARPDLAGALDAGQHETDGWADGSHRAGRNRQARCDLSWIE